MKFGPTLWQVRICVVQVVSKMADTGTFVHCFKVATFAI